MSMHVHSLYVHTVYEAMNIAIMRRLINIASFLRGIMLHFLSCRRANINHIQIPSSLDLPSTKKPDSIIPFIY